MDKTGNVTRFFLGANSGEGFVSHFDELNNMGSVTRKIIIKGGPGTGKSQMMMRVGKHYENAGRSVEYVHCSSDPQSLDGIIVDELGICIADGTAPHIIEPELPGVRDSIVNTGECWDEKQLSGEKELVTSIQSSISEDYSSAYRALKGAERLKDDNYNIAVNALNRPKLTAFIARLIKKEIIPLDRDYGREYKRYLSGITPEGICIYWDTVTQLCDRVYCIDDEFGLGRIILEAVRSDALKKKHTVFTCFCPLYQKEVIEHILLPDIRTAFITSNESHPYYTNAYKHINMTRFTDNEEIRLHRNRIKFNRKTAAVLIEKSIELFRGIKENHDKLEKCYINSMDFNKIEELTKSVIDRLDSFVSNI